MKSITVEGFGQGSNGTLVTIGNLELWFSYKTIIAFRESGHTTRVSENCWNVTTGRHLNAIDGGNKADRLPRDRFEAEIQRLLKMNRTQAETIEKLLTKPSTGKVKP